MLRALALAGKTRLWRSSKENWPSRLKSPSPATDAISTVLRPVVRDRDWFVEVAGFRFRRGGNMALVLKGGAVFLHIPKTGGNWVTVVLRECGLIAGTLCDHLHKHADLRQVLADYHSAGLLPSLRRRPNPFLFCFVRHPLTWYESWFKYASSPKVRWRTFGDRRDVANWHPNALLNGLRAPDFNQFVRNVIERRPGYVTELYGWYTEPPVDFIGRQECLREDLIRVLQQLELDFDEQFIRNYRRFGVSPSPRTRITWDANLRDEVLRLEYAGLVRYGYADSAAPTRARPRENAAA